MSRGRDRGVGFDPADSKDPSDADSNFGQNLASTEGGEAMQRRDFINKAATGLVAGVAAGAAVGCTGPAGSAPGVVTSPRVKWRLASSFPRSLDTIFGASEIFADRVKAMTDGRFNIRVFPAGELVGGLEVMDAVESGAAEVGHSASYYYTGKNPAFVFDCAVPFGLEARQQMAWVSSAGGGELMKGLFSDHNIIPLPGGNTGVQMGGWFRRRIDSLSDLQGLKMRIPGLGGEVMTRLGATVQVLPGGDIYPSLERGAIDATEWVGPYDDEKLGFHRVAKNYYYPGWWEPGPALTFFINKDAWSKLPKSYQAIVQAASAEAAKWMLTEYDAKNPPALTRLLASGVALRPFSEDVMNKAKEETRAILEEQAAADTRYRKIYEHWKKFRAESSAWLSTAELTYAQFAAQNA